MIERIAVASLAVISLLSLWLAPFAALARQTGARSTVLLLPQRVIDFSGRYDPLLLPALSAVLLLSVLALLLLLLASFLAARWRYPLWLVVGLFLIVLTATGLNQIQQTVQQARVQLISEALSEALAAPRETMNVEALGQVLTDVSVTPVEMTILRARQAGLTIRRLAYSGSGIGFAAFSAILTGLLAMVFSLRFSPQLSRWLDRVFTMIAIPAVAIVLSLLVAAFVILALQPTPTDADFVFNWQTYLTGRIEVLWFAYLTLFSNSLTTVGGFAESLKFATPLIFTGLAVAFGFQAGLFNIGAPGQMVLGAVAAMLVGLYMPGPSFIVLPLAVLAAAAGGGLWGAIPGWLKARFGANEVINTILMNYIASAILLFMLSSNLVFAAAAVRVLAFLGVLLLMMMVLLLIPVIRQYLTRAPRLSFALVLLAALIGMVAFSLPRVADAPVSFTMPFKQPGFEPKSFALQETARLPRLLSFLGVEAQGEVILSLNIAAGLAALAFVVAVLLLSRVWQSSWWQRLLAALGLALGVYGLGLLMGLGSRPVLIPPSNLNASFIIAILTAVFMYYFLWRTRWGYELRAVGLAPKAAEYGGASIARNTILAMTLSGAFAGLTACHYVLGGALEDYSLRQSLPTGDGFDGIAVALLGANTPVGVVLAAFLFGVLKNGGTILNVTFTGLTRDVVSMILALVVLFIAAKGFLPESVTHPLRRRLRLEPSEKSQANTEVK